MKQLLISYKTAIIAGLLECCSILASASGTFIPTPPCVYTHNINNLVLPILNDAGIVGEGRDIVGVLQPCFQDGRFFKTQAFPKNIPAKYIFLGMPCIGAIVDNDTIAYAISATTRDALDFYPDEYPFGLPIYRSISDPALPDKTGAVSEQDFSVQYTDTLRDQTIDRVTNRYNKRLHARMTVISYAWSYQYTEDFVFFKVTIENTGNRIWKDAYIGWYGTLGGAGNYANQFGFDDMTGFLGTYPSTSECNFDDTLNLAWAADADGDPVNGMFQTVPIVTPDGLSVSPTSVVAIKPLSRYYPDTKMQFNWTAWNNTPHWDVFTPQKRVNFRSYETNGDFSGAPFGNRFAYHDMSNGEIDFDQAYVARLQRNDPVWTHEYGNPLTDIAEGSASHQMLTFGPFQVQPGASLEFAFAIVMGEHFHHDPHNFENNMPNNPAAYMANLDFSDLAKNALWAEWIYDNPGVDTDGDGYFGESRICVTDSSFIDGHWTPTHADTTWYRGDGIPDWKAAGPPPAPYVTVTPILNGLKIRFNGERSETEKDVFLQMVDFEGYRVYWGRDQRQSSLSAIATYDHENYDKWVFIGNIDDSGLVTGRYEIKDIPYTLDSLRCLYANSCIDSAFDPLAYTNYAPYHLADSTFYFTKHDYNTSELGITTPIHKVYPTVRDPRGIPADQLTADDYTEEHHLKFFEYETEIHDLLPTVSYWVNVTAFDFGSPISGLGALETSPTLNIQQAFPASSQDEIAQADLKVYVYPNPYRIDADYRSHGFEGRTREDFPNDKVRQLNFANLPYRCTIRVYSLDGDLVVEKAHDADPSDPTGRHDYWSLINKNRQIIVSGLYYWTVEDENGHVQIGKFVVLR